MRAAFYDTFAGPITIEDVPAPEPPRDGVVIRVEATGVCRSDWHGWMGHDPDIRLPHVPGHELAGVVEEVGRDVKNVARGARVTVPFAVGCGRCPTCVAGNPHICDDHFQPGFTAWGSFAPYVAIPHADLNLVPLPEAVGFVEAASLGCRFATAFRAVVNQGRLAAGETLVVHGCGGVGLSCVMIGHALGARVIGVDIEPEALRFAQDVGADDVLDATTVDDVPLALRSMTDGGAHVSVDALGGAVTCSNSVGGLRKRGRHVQVGLMVEGDTHTPLPWDQVIARELEILGSHGLPAPAYSGMLEMITGGRLDPARLVTGTVSLEEGVRVLEAMGSFARRGVVVIDPRQ